MSRLFGPVRQLGYVIGDIDAAMEHWTRQMGVGPFFYLPDAQFIDFRHRGAPSDVRISAAFAQCGPVQIELIQLGNDAPSLWREFHNAGHQGLQHIAFWHDEKNYDRVLKGALAAGYTVAMSAASIEPSGKLVYFDQQDHPGTAIELSCLSPKKKAVFDMIAEAAIGWDGSDPVRRFDGA